MAAVLSQQSTELPKAPLPLAPSKSKPDYKLDIKQQPRQARMCGSGEKADRRPVDPPPIISVRIKASPSRSSSSSSSSGAAKKRNKGTATTSNNDLDYVSPTLTHTLFCFASLVGETDDEELYLLSGSRSKHVTGSVVSSLFHLKDQSCFVFPDLSVRTEGRWRFKMSMYEIVEDGVHFCASVFTEPFTVYSSKRFPGMGESTALSKAFAQQGLRLRIRRPGPSLKHDEEVDMVEERVVPRQRKPSAAGRSAGPPSLSSSASLPSLASRKRSQQDLATIIQRDEHFSHPSFRPSYPSTQQAPPQRRIASLPRSYGDAPGPRDDPRSPAPYPGPQAYPSYGSYPARPPVGFHADVPPPGYRQPPPPPNSYYYTPDSYGAPHHSRPVAPPPPVEAPTILAPIRSHARAPSDTSASQLSSSARSSASTSATSHYPDIASRPTTAGAGASAVAGAPPFLPAPSRSPVQSVSWERERQRYHLQQQQGGAAGADPHYAGMVRQVESSERRGSGPEEEEGESEAREPEEKRRKSSGGASLAKLLGEGARDAKDVVDPQEPFFFDES